MSNQDPKRIFTIMRTEYSFAQIEAQTEEEGDGDSFNSSVDGPEYRVVDSEVSE